MSRLTRRSFLAAAGAVAAGPAVAATQQKSKAPTGEPRSGLDVVIIGAGVAGIAAARRIVAAGRKCVVL
ncbi:MAG TPA: twin-arginine translocation signal domain-containing protein, partial [Xanthobacteraceae bacterium]|nr:twin-arginine translocation signal domain-containing protein [Xanthobacteraceae bacterium]